MPGHFISQKARELLSAVDADRIAVGVSAYNAALLPLTAFRLTHAAGGNWTRIARLVWVSDSVVDGATYPVFGQIVAGVRFAAIGESGNAFVGFALLGGLSFRGGASIAHDPTVTADVQADLVLPGSGTPGSLVVALVGGVAVVAVILLILVLVTRRRKRQTLPPPPPET